MPGRILLCEDDTNFGMVLKSYLELNAFEVTLCRNGNEGLTVFKQANFDICLLDVMMPLKDGFTLGKEIKQLKPETPLIYLTAKSMKEDMLQGYKIGADDYISKPFDSELLLYKIRAVLKRGLPDAKSEPKMPDDFLLGKFRFNSKLRLLSLEGQEWKLSPKENALLEMLCINRSGLLSREEALLKIWQADNYFTARSMDVYVAKLRKILREDARIEIVNIHGNGFRLVCPEN